MVLNVIYHFPGKTYFKALLTTGLWALLQSWKATVNAKHGLKLQILLPIKQKELNNFGDYRFICVIKVSVSSINAIHIIVFIEK